MTRKPWTPAEDRLVVSLPPAEAATKTGRTVDAVYKRRIKLRVMDSKPPRGAAGDGLVSRMPAALLDAIRAGPAGKRRWLALAAWLRDHGRTDEAATVRVFWATLRDTVKAGMSVESTLRQMARHAATLGRRARRVEASDE